MAGASTTLTIVDPILKEIYEARIRDQLNSEVITLKRIEKTSEGVSHDVGGKYVAFPIRTRRNHGIGARNENEPLPDPRSQKYAAARVNLAYLYGALSLTGQSMELAENNSQAFASVLDSEIEGLRETLTKDTNRQMYGTSDGIMATITADGSNTFTVSSTQYLEVGMMVDVWDVTFASEKLDNREITAINTSTGVVTYSGADGTTAATDVVTRTGSQQREKIGFRQIVAATGALYNINPATEPVWASTVLANGGVNRPLSEGLMIKMVDDIRTQGGGSPTVIFTSLGVRRAYFQLLSQQRRYNDTVEFAGGFKGLKFETDGGEIPVISDTDAQGNRMYFINEKQIKLYEANSWSFMNRDGSNWQRVIQSTGNYDAYQAMLYKYCQVGTHRRNSHGLLSDLAEAS
jgi:hypothetical protein